MSGEATAPTAICDRATSGAWKTKKKMPEQHPEEAHDDGLAQRIAGQHDRPARLRRPW